MKILLINLKHLGDVILTTPLVGSLKAYDPSCSITMLVDKGMEEAVSGTPMIDEVLALERKETLKEEMISQWHLIGKLRHHQFDLSIDAGAADRGAFLSWLSRAKMRIGYIPLRRKQAWRAKLFTHPVPDRSNFKHTVLHHLDLLLPLGIQPVEKEVLFGFTSQDVEKVNTILHKAFTRLPKPYVVIHPTSRWMFKSWTPQGYAEVAEYLIKDRGWSVILTCAPVEAEKAFLNEITARSSLPLINIGGELSLRELGALISKAIFFFGVDTAPMHIAAALKIPTVALFGPSGEHMWGPWGEGHLVIKKNWDCRPCGKAGCDDTGISRCLVEITPEEVITKLEGFFKERGLV
ncbi:MAG: putative lipopolysaccharide heptosyltransferase III [Deltaproteobacteria bacterium RBG_13_43_22]|nr:MAG: putative lipopolysaccharide heptosyltransferase III [Deltaproteobacteria bacterium RBG_13_43_22]